MSDPSPTSVGGVTRWHESGRCVPGIDAPTSVGEPLRRTWVASAASRSTAWLRWASPFGGGVSQGLGAGDRWERLSTAHAERGCSLGSVGREPRGCLSGQRSRPSSAAGASVDPLRPGCSWDRPHEPSLETARSEVPSLRSRGQQLARAARRRASRGVSSHQGVTLGSRQVGQRVGSRACLGGGIPAALRS